MSEGRNGAVDSRVQEFVLPLTADDLSGSTPASRRPPPLRREARGLRQLQEIAFGRIVVEDPLLCDVCKALLCIDQIPVTSADI